MTNPTTLPEIYQQLAEIARLRKHDPHAYVRAALAPLYQRTSAPRAKDIDWRDFITLAKGKQSPADLNADLARLAETLNGKSSHFSSLASQIHRLAAQATTLVLQAMAVPYARQQDFAGIDALFPPGGVRHVRHAWGVAWTELALLTQQDQDSAISGRFPEADWTPTTSPGGEAIDWRVLTLFGELGKGVDADAATIVVMNRQTGGSVWPNHYPTPVPLSNEGKRLKAIGMFAQAVQLRDDARWHETGEAMQALTNAIRSLPEQTRTFSAWGETVQLLVGPHDVEVTSDDLQMQLKQAVSNVRNTFNLPQLPDFPAPVVGQSIGIGHVA